MMIEKAVVSPLILAPKMEGPMDDLFGQPRFDFGREVGSHLAVAEEREWLGFAALRQVGPILLDQEGTLDFDFNAAFTLDLQPVMEAERLIQADQPETTWLQVPHKGQLTFSIS